MSFQLELLFNVSKDAEPYYCKYLQKQEEICAGGLVYEIGKKPSCQECAKTCAGCIEMRINLGTADFKDVKHLIQRPEMLIKKYRSLYEKAALS